MTYTAAVHGVPALMEALNFKRGPKLANMMISNPFGLPERRYSAGAEIEMALPLPVSRVSVTGSQRMYVCVM